MQTGIILRRITHHMLQRMSVDRDDSNGSSPLMVLLVEMLVKAGVVEEPATDEDELETITLWRMLVVQLVCHPFCKCFLMSKL